MSTRPATPHVSRELVARMVDMTLSALEDLSRAGELSIGDLTRDPLTTLEQWPAVDVRRLSTAATVPSSPSLYRDCNVAGTYYDSTAQSRAIIAVAESWSAGRNAFTALHELGHHLQRTTADLADQLGELPPDASFLVEDAVCDRFAAAVLIPADVAVSALGQGTPTAGDVVTLASRTSASRAAVCVRAAQQLSGPGIIVLLNGDDHVEFSSASGHVYALRRGSDQGDVPLVRKARERLADGGTNFRVTDDDCHLTYRDGIEGDSLYAQAADIGGGYLVIVAVTEAPPWKGGFAVPKVSKGPSAKDRICPHPECGEYFASWAESHSVCGEPICTNCQRCACSPRHVQERRCVACNLVLPNRMFEADSEQCRDCAW